MTVTEFILDKLNIRKSDYVHGYKRGVFFSPIYSNFKEFLTSKVSEDALVLKNQYDDAYMVSWWKEKAIKRYLSLLDKNSIKNEILFYNKGCRSSYKQFKDMYFKEVGR